MTKYLINEEQLILIVNEQREDTIVKRIVSEIELAKTKLNENSMMSGAIIDIILKYHKKGHLTENVIEKLEAKNIEI